MNVKRILGYVVLAFSALLPAFAAENTSLNQVKTLVFRDASVSGDPSKIPNDPGPQLHSFCKAALDTRLSEAGFTFQKEPNEADAELSVELVFYTTGPDVELSYSLRIRSLPGGNPLFASIGKTTGHLAVACDRMAKRIVKEILKAKVEPTK